MWDYGGPGRDRAIYLSTRLVSSESAFYSSGSMKVPQAEVGSTYLSIPRIWGYQLSI